MGECFIPAEFAVAPAENCRRGAAGRGERFKAKTGENPRRASVPRVWDQNHSCPSVELLKLRCFFRLSHSHRLHVFVILGRANVGAVQIYSWVPWRALTEIALLHLLSWIDRPGRGVEPSGCLERAFSLLVGGFPPADLLFQTQRPGSGPPSRASAPRQTRSAPNRPIPKRLAACSPSGRPSSGCWTVCTRCPKITARRSSWPRSSAFPPPRWPSAWAGHAKPSRFWCIAP